MAQVTAQPALLVGVPDIEQYPLLRVCSLLNAEGAKYLVIGGRAVILHGLVRTTEDVDILIEVSTRAWKITYAEAAASALETMIDGVKIPYLGWDALLASKQTYHEKDQIDLLQLRQLKERR